MTLRHEAQGWSAEKTVVLKPEEAAPVWRLRTLAGPPPVIRYRSRHQMKDGTVRDSAELTTTRTGIMVDDPFPDALEILFFPFLDASQVTKLFVDVEYSDPDNRYERKERLEIPGSATEEVKLRLALMDPTKRRFKYRVTFIKPTGIVQKPPVETEKTMVSLTE